MHYELLGFLTLNTRDGCDAERREYRLADAKKDARRMLSREEQLHCGFAEPLAIVQIWKVTKTRTLIAEVTPPAPSIKATLAAIKATGATARCVDGEYRVNTPGGKEATASYTNDAEDAIGTARAMMARHNGEA